MFRNALGWYLFGVRYLGPIILLRCLSVKIQPTYRCADLKVGGSPADPYLCQFVHLFEHYFPELEKFSGT
jgi:hypothetical protein